jgi:photosystem II stability/assembly factor-like uncharacterized protein
VGSLPAQTGLGVVLVDPKQPKRVHGAGDSGVYRSEDGGRSWQRAGGGLPDGGVTALALDPRQPQRLYAAASTGALYLSEDGAKSWRALAGTGRRAK